MENTQKDNTEKEFNEVLSEVKAKVAEMREANDKNSKDLALKFSEEVGKLEKMQSELSQTLVEMKRSGTGGAQATKGTPYRDSLNKFIRAMKSDACSWRSSDVKLERKEDPAPAPQTGVAGTDAYGGYLVPDELDNQILKSILANNVVYANVARRVVSTPDFYIPVRVAGVATEWLNSETATITQQDAPQFKQISPVWGNLASRADLSVQLIEDSQFDVVAYLMDEFGIAFADALENTLTTNTASGKPIGLLGATLAATADKTRTVGTYQKINTAGSLSADHLIKLFCAAKPGYRVNGAFMLNSTTELEVRLLKDGENRYIWQPSIAVDRPATILNCPILINEYMQDTGTATNIPVIFGDFKRGFGVFERTGLHIKQDDITGDLVVKYKCFKRYGSQFLDSCALKYLVYTAS